MSGPPELPPSAPPPLPRHAPPLVQMHRRTSTKRSTPPVIIIIVLALMVPMGAAILLPALARAREAARRASCQQNLKEINAAVKEYQKDNDGALPAVFSDIYPKYISEAERLLCPSNPDAMSGDEVSVNDWCDYEFVNDSTAKGLIVQEKSEEFHVPGGMNYLYEDGHVEFKRREYSEGIDQLEVIAS